MSLHPAACLLALTLPGLSLDCRQLAPAPSINRYSVKVRVRTRDQSPVPRVLIGIPDSGARGLTDRQGEITFRVDGLEGTAFALRVEGTPDGIVEEDGHSEHRLILKSIVGQPGPERQHDGVLTHDLWMRRTREVYVVLVSTRGVGDLEVTANGMKLGRLNSLGAGAFRLKGQPGEELKVVIHTGAGRGLTQLNPEQTFTLPASSSILSFASTLSSLPELLQPSAAPPIVTFLPKPPRHHRGRPAAPPPPAAPGIAAPIQVPFRGVELK
jgi:hypothetical protein